MSWSLPMSLAFFGFLLHHGLEGHLLPKATYRGGASETHQSTHNSRHSLFHTLLSSISRKSVQAQMPQPQGVSCKDLMPDALENFATVPRAAQILIQASLALALQSIGCSWHAETLVLQLYKELGEDDANALLFTLAGAPDSTLSPSQNNSSTALEFNLGQLAHTQGWHCKGLTQMNGSLLHGKVHHDYRGFRAAAAACHQLGERCAGVTSNGTDSFQVLYRDGSYFLPHYGTHSWLHQCRRLVRGRRSTSEDCVSKKEQQVHKVMEWIPGLSTYYNFATSLYYATQDCTDLAKERALEGAMDLGFDMLTSGAGVVVKIGLGATLRPGLKAGMRTLIDYFNREERSSYPVPSNYSGPVVIM